MEDYFIIKYTNSYELEKTL